MKSPIALGKRKPAGRTRRVLSAALAAVVASFVAVVGRKLFGGEGNPAEHLAGILGAAAPGGVAALLGGNGVVQHRDHQLGVPLQPDNGELSQGDKQPPLPAREHQLLVEDRADALGNLGRDGIAGAFANVPDLGTQHHGVQNLHHGGRPVRRANRVPVGAGQTGIAAEDVGPAVLAAQDGPFAEYSQSVKGRGAAGAYHRVRQHTVVESDVDAVVVPVKGDRLHRQVLTYENHFRNQVRYHHHHLHYHHHLHHFHL